jgi:predicted AlkP superfamily phosphohydrolase/phosphomutase
MTPRIQPVSLTDAEPETRELLDSLSTFREDDVSVLNVFGTIAHRPEDLYEERNGIPPDLMVYFGDLYWRSIGQVGTGAIHVFENDTGPDDANHAHNGLYILAGGGAAPGPGPQREIRDIAPTLLALLGEPIPAEMEGTSLV